MSARLPEGTTLFGGLEDEQRILVRGSGNVLKRSFRVPKNGNFSSFRRDSEERPPHVDWCKVTHGLIEHRERAVVASIAHHAFRQDGFGVPHRFGDRVLGTLEASVATTAKQASTVLCCL